MSYEYQIERPELGILTELPGSTCTQYKVYVKGRQ